MTPKRTFVYLFSMLALAVGLVLTAAGCNADQRAAATALDNQLGTQLDGLQAQLVTLKAQAAAAATQPAATQPATADPAAAAAAAKASAELTKAIGDIQAAIAKAQAARDQVHSLVDEINAGNAGGPATVATIAAIPGVGPYAPLIGLAVALGWGVYQRAKAGNTLGTLTDVVHSIEVAFPAKTDPQKQALASVQGAATTATVDAIKTSLGL